jgi:DNA-binding XRE family transcriptional regulator
MNTKETALARTEMIVRVRAGLMTATKAAEVLGVSRKTYYKWEKKGLQAMLAAERDETAGRPDTGPTAEVAALKTQVAELTAKLDHMAQTAELRYMLRLLERRDAKKKQKKSPGSSP